MTIKERIKNVEGKTWIILVLCLVLITVTTLFSYYYLLPKYNNYYYQLGVNDGVASLVNKINQDGMIPILRSENNQTIVKQYKIEDICKGNIQ